MTTKFLDLDAVKPETGFTLKLNGAKHDLVETDIETFIENSKDIERLGVTSSSTEELQLTIRMIKRAFPTILESELMKLKLSQLKAINDFALTANGEKAEEQISGESEADGEAGNEPAGDK